MNAQEIIQLIRDAEKKTPVRMYVREKAPVDYGTARVFCAGDKIVFGDWNELEEIVRKNSDRIEDIVIENDCRNSALHLLDTKNLHARIEPGAFIREQVEIGDNAVIMMGAVINIGAVIGDGSMVDMGAVIGGRAEVGRNCHIGAGAVLAGVVEPASGLIRLSTVLFAITLDASATPLASPIAPATIPGVIAPVIGVGPTGPGRANSVDGIPEYSTGCGALEPATSAPEL